MNRFLKYWRITGRGEKFQAQVVNYADDFVILSRHFATEALNWTRGVMTRIGLTLNDAKTSTKEARAEQFDFLGYTLVRATYPLVVSRRLTADRNFGEAQADRGRDAAGRVVPGEQKAYRERPDSDGFLGRIDREVHGPLCHAVESFKPSEPTYRIH